MKIWVDKLIVYPPFHQVLIVMGRGNPGVFSSVPVPLPGETRTRSHGFGFLTGKREPYPYPYPGSPYPRERVRVSPGSGKSDPYPHPWESLPMVAGRVFSRVCKNLTRMGRGTTRDGFFYTR